MKLTHESQKLRISAQVHIIGVIEFGGAVPFLGRPYYFVFRQCGRFAKLCTGRSINIEANQPRARAIKDFSLMFFIDRFSV